MKIVVIGGSGRIGSKLVELLRSKGHDVLAASPASGVNTITGEGLAKALEGASVVVDVANAPSFEDGAVMDFFKTSGRNLLAAETTAGVQHHVALSIVGADRMRDSGYMRAKVAQEDLIRASAIPYTILRSTQFFEFIGSIAQAGADGAVRLSPAQFQPIAVDDLIPVLAGLTLGAPRNAVVEVAGPEAGPLDQFARKLLATSGNAGRVITDRAARYFGAELNDQSLTPGGNPLLGTTRFRDWLDRTVAMASA